MPFTVGKPAHFRACKVGRQTPELFHYDYFVDHPLFQDRDILRGLVTGIKAVFVDKFAGEEGEINNPNNTFAIFDASYIDMFDDIGDYQGREPKDAAFYILIMEDVVVYPNLCRRKGRGKKPLRIELDGEGGSSELFWNTNLGKAIGDVNGIKIGKEYISLAEKPWHDTLVEYANEFAEHKLVNGAQWTLKSWLEWWLKGWALAKKIIKLLPPDTILYYGCAEAYRRDLIRSCNDDYQLFTCCLWIALVDDLSYKIDRGIYFPKVSLDLSFDEDELKRYKISIAISDHHFLHDDRIVLCTVGREAYQLATIDEVGDDYIIFVTDEPLDISEEYSIELLF